MQYYHSTQGLYRSAARHSYRNSKYHNDTHPPSSNLICRVFGRRRFKSTLGILSIVVITAFLLVTFDKYTEISEHQQSYIGANINLIGIDYKTPATSQQAKRMATDVIKRRNNTDNGAIGLHGPSNNKMSDLTSHSVSDSTSHFLSKREGLHIITFLSVFAGSVWPGYEKFTEAQRRGRDQEVISSLSHNLNNSLVEKIHLLYYKDHELQAVTNLNLHNAKKINAVKQGRLIHMSDYFIYASKHLINKTAVAMNSDIVLGEGFDRIATEKMSANKILFSLSRYGDINNRCQKYPMCRPEKYIGSHDAHIFRLTEPLDERILLSKLDYPTNLWQAENGMIFVMQKYFNFTVRNPCLSLKTHHEHCSVVHGPHDDGDKYTVRDLQPFNITTHEIRLSSLGHSAIDKNITYSRERDSICLTIVPKGKKHGRVECRPSLG